MPLGCERQRHCLGFSLSKPAGRWNLLRLLRLLHRGSARRRLPPKQSCAPVWHPACTDSPELDQQEAHNVCEYFELWAHPLVGGGDGRRNRGVDRGVCGRQGDVSHELVRRTGLYEKAGLDVTLKMGGPQVNGMQLLLAGETDFMMGYDLQVLKMLEQGLPVITVATSFQFDLQGIMAHDHVAGLGDLKDKTILVATPGRTTWWPWLKAKFKYTDEQTKPYTFNLQPFFADKNVVQQSYPSSEPFQAKLQGVPVKFFLFAHDGYPPYGTTMVATRAFADNRADVAARFVKASLEGWKGYLTDPSPG